MDCYLYLYKGHYLNCLLKINRLFRFFYTSERSDRILSETDKIIRYIGGKSNISGLSHCMTRLRFTLENQSLADDEKLKSLNCVRGVFRNNSQYQVVTGENTLRLYNEISQKLRLSESGSLFSCISGNFKKYRKNKSDDKIIISSPVSGKIIPLSEVDDPMFSLEILGKGFAVIPSENKITAPFDGMTDMVSDNSHAVQIVSSDNIKLFIHIGLETAKLDNGYFRCHTSEHEHFRKGDVLVEFDSKKLENSGISMVIPVIVMNSDDYHIIKIIENNDVSSLQETLTLVKN